MLYLSIKVLSHANAKKKTERLRGFKFYILIGRFISHYGSEGVNLTRATNTTPLKLLPAVQAIHASATVTSTLIPAFGGRFSTRNFFLYRLLVAV